jgi:hypothetical protein
VAARQRLQNALDGLSAKHGSEQYRRDPSTKEAPRNNAPQFEQALVTLTPA